MRSPYGQVMLGSQPAEVTFYSVQCTVYIVKIVICTVNSTKQLVNRYLQLVEGEGWRRN